ncbi:MAG: MauE/DoxX family redox-associated membrane protein [Terrimicrobiaceae bacterium]
MKRILESHRFLLLLRVALGGLFLYAGAVKIGNPQAFADSIATFKILPDYLINIVALGLPPFEILLGLMLVAGWKTRASSLALSALAFVFCIAFAQAMARGLSVECGCFGSGKPSPLKTWMSFGRAAMLLLAGAWIYSNKSKPRLAQ